MKIESLDVLKAKEQLAKSNDWTDTYQFKISDNMVEHLDSNELSLFLNSLEDAIEEVCANYNVEPWEYKEVL